MIFKMNFLCTLLIVLVVAPSHIHCMKPIESTGSTAYMEPIKDFAEKLAAALSKDDRSAMKTLLIAAKIEQMRDSNALEALLRVGSADLLQSYLFLGLDAMVPVGMCKFTPLAYALMHKDTEPEVIAILKDYGVPICWPETAQSSRHIIQEQDPLYLCTDPKASALFKQLVAHGAPIRTWHRGYHPLISAATQGATETVRFLLERNIPVSIANDSGVTPLLAAAWKNRCAVASMLIESGADVNTRDKRNITPLCAAAMRGYKAMTKLLLAAGADACIVDRKGKNALQYARERGDNEIISLLTQDLRNNPQKYSWLDIDFKFPVETYHAEVSDCEGAFLNIQHDTIMRDDVPGSDRENDEQEPPSDSE